MTSNGKRRALRPLVDGIDPHDPAPVERLVDAILALNQPDGQRRDGASKPRRPTGRSARGASHETRIRHCPTVQTSAIWPVPIDMRLNALLEVVHDGGGSASRSELLAALICSAPSDTATLVELVRSYRAMNAGEVLDSTDPTFTLPERKRGPRPKRA